jgi:hypothetical protein
VVPALGGPIEYWTRTTVGSMFWNPFFIESIAADLASDWPATWRINTVFHVAGTNLSRIVAIHHLKKGFPKLEEMSCGQLRTN